MPEHLIQLAESEGIFIDTCRLPEGVNGYYTKTQLPPVILISNKIQSRSLFRVILAEELGHHFTGSCVIGYAGKMTSLMQMNNKIERKALLWSAEYLMPPEQVVQTIWYEGIRNIFELAEYFDVTERFASVALRLYWEQGLIQEGMLCPDIYSRNQGIGMWY